MFLKSWLDHFFKHKPAGYNLNVCINIRESEFLYEDNTGIFNDLSVFSKFFSGKKEYYPVSLFEPPKFKKNDLKFLSEASGEKKDFFSLKGAEYLKTTLLATFLSYYFKNEQETKTDNVELLKEIITRFENNPFFLCTNLLFHISGKNSLSADQTGMIVRNRTFVKSMFHVFREMKVSEWYSFTDILRFINLRSLDTDILGKADLSRLYIPYANEYGKKEQKFFSGKNDYRELFMTPLIKGIFFLFSALGIFDIKYNSPKDPLKSAFQGLSYIKLTNAGTYLIGITDSFDFKPEENTSKTIIEDNELTIKIKGNDKTAAMFLTSFAEQISPNMYVVNYSSFLKECRSKNDIEEKIALFKKEFSANPSETWTSFFDNALKRFSLFKEETDLVVYKIAPDKELMELLVKDSILKNLVIKVEGSRIAVYKENFSKVKKRLGEFGYYIEI